MATLQEVLVKVRERIKEDKVQYFSDTTLLNLANDVLERFYYLMQTYQCKYLSLTEVLTLTAAEDYVLTDFGSIIPKYVITSLGFEVPVYSGVLDDNFSYLENSTGITFKNGSEQIGTQVSVSYWTPIPVLTAVTDDVPWDSIWDIALQRNLVVECQEIRERDISRTAVLAGDSTDSALAAVIKKSGCFVRTMEGTLNA